MAQRRSHPAEYVLVPDRKPKLVQSYYFESDDDDDIPPVITSKRVIQRKPSKEQRIKYVEAATGEPEHEIQNTNESGDHGIKIRNTTSGEQLVLDEDDNILKIIRTQRTPTPPLLVKRRIRANRSESRKVYYETADGHIIQRPANRYESLRDKPQYVYIDESPKVVRKIIIDPQTNEQEIIYEKEKPRLAARQKIKIRKPVQEIIVDPDYDYEQIEEQPEYVKVVNGQAAPREIIIKKEPKPKYVMIRKKVDPESSYTLASPTTPIPTNRRVVYATKSQKKSPTKYVYGSDGKYYK